MNKDQNKRNRWQSRGMEIGFKEGSNILSSLEEPHKLMNVKVNKGMSFAYYLGSLLTRRRRRLLFVT
jgi:hypothetical protein